MSSAIILYSLPCGVPAKFFKRNAGLGLLHLLATVTHEAVKVYMPEAHVNLRPLGFGSMLRLAEGPTFFNLDNLTFSASS